MSYEYTVNIPASKRAKFRAMVKEMGGDVSRGRKTPDDDIPNATTIKAMKEVESGIDLETLDVAAFHKYVLSL